MKRINRIQRNNMYKYLILALFLPLFCRAQELKEIDTRGVFSTGVARPSPFRFPEADRSTEALKGIQSYTEVGVAEMLNRFIHPQGIILREQNNDNKLLLNGLVLNVGDTIRIQTITPKDFRYTYPVADLTVEVITKNYVEFLHAAQNRSYRIDINFLPNLHQKLHTFDLGEAKIIKLLTR